MCQAQLRQVDGRSLLPLQHTTRKDSNLSGCAGARRQLGGCWGPLFLPVGPCLQGDLLLLGGFLPLQGGFLLLDI